MAVGVISHERKNNGRGRWKKGCHDKRVAISFNDQQLAEVNTFARKRRLSFAAAVRQMLFGDDA